MKPIVIVLAALIGASVPAAAQSIHSVDILPPAEAAAIVRSTGLHPISRPVWRPGRYIVHAVDRRGREYRVVVDARVGEVVSANPVPPEVVSGFYEDGPPPGTFEPYSRAARPGRPVAALPEPGFEEDRDPPPPGASPRVIMAPNNAAKPAAPSAARTPAKTPLPRPRPEAAFAAASAPAASPPASAPKAETAKSEPAPNDNGAQSWPPVQPLDDVPALRF